MCALLDEALSEDALGLSLASCTPPNATLPPRNSPGSRALRPGTKSGDRPHPGEGRSAVSSIDEMLTIGRDSGASIHISHMKAAGSDMWGWAVETMLAHIQEAKREGLDVSFDAYPYTAGSTTLLTLLPPEALAGGVEGVLSRIADPAGRAAILDSLDRERDGWDNFVKSLGWGRVIVSGSSDEREIGRTIQALAEEARPRPREYVLDLLLREKARVPIVLEEWTRTTCGGSSPIRLHRHLRLALLPASGKPHPRKYGAFQRFSASTSRRRSGSACKGDRQDDPHARGFPAPEGARPPGGGVLCGPGPHGLGGLQDRATYADPRSGARASQGLINEKSPSSMGSSRGRRPAS